MLQGSDHELGRAGGLEHTGDGERRADDDDELEGKAAADLGQAEQAAHDEPGRQHDQPREQGNDLEGGQGDDEREAAEGEPALACGEPGADWCAAHDDEVAIEVAVVREVRADCQEQAVARAQGDAPELAGDLLIATTDADDAGVEHGAKVDAAQRLVHQLGFGRHDHLDEVRP